jgi:undecaprenyl-diphosphatase
MMRIRFTLIVLLAAALPALASAESLDARLFHQIRGRWQRTWLDQPMDGLTRLGGTTGNLAVCAGVGLFCGPRGRDAAKLALCADAGSALVTYGLKNAVNRQRPEGETTRSNSSFPSGHATAAFALATVFAHDCPRLAIPCYTLASGVALSRIYLGRHYPSDVLAGAAIGFVTAKLALHFREKILGFEIPPQKTEKVKTVSDTDAH